MGKEEITICPECGLGYDAQYGPCDCKKKTFPETKKKKKTVDIPKGNIETYLHWYELLTKIKELPYKEEDYDKPLKILKDLQERYNLDDDWLWKAYKPITLALNERDNISDPFRRVRHLMVYGHKYCDVPYEEMYPNSPSLYGGSFKVRDYRKKREGTGSKTNWGFNVLLVAIVEDCHWWGKGKRFVEALRILEDLNITEAKKLEYDTLRIHHGGIDEMDLDAILKALYEACSEKQIPFIPEGVSISEWPVDFLARTAHYTGYKKNPYLSGEKHLTDEMKESLSPHLKKLLKKPKVTPPQIFS